MTFDRSGEPSPFRFADDLDLVAVREDVDLYLVTDRRFRLTGQTDLFQDPGRWNTAAGLFEMSAKRLRHVLQTNRAVLDEAELDGIIAITSGGAFHLDDNTRSRFDDGHRRYRSVLREDLRHSDFSSNDSANHNFSILDFGFAILDFSAGLKVNPKSKI